VKLIHEKSKMQQPSFELEKLPSIEAAMRSRARKARQSSRSTTLALHACYHAHRLSSNCAAHLMSMDLVRLRHREVLRFSQQRNHPQK